MLSGRNDEYDETHNHKPDDTHDDKHDDTHDDKHDDTHDDSHGDIHDDKHDDTCDHMITHRNARQGVEQAQLQLGVRFSVQAVQHEGEQREGDRGAVWEQGFHSL